MAKEFEVGYGKPPKHSQFKPGQSGNPNGRPKGTLSIETLIDNVLSQKILITDSKGRRKVSAREAIAMKLVEKALKGDPKALETISRLDKQRHPQRTEENESLVLTANETELLETIFREDESAEKSPDGPDE